MRVDGINSRGEQCYIQSKPPVKHPFYYQPQGEPQYCAKCQQERQLYQVCPASCCVCADCIVNSILSTKQCLCGFALSSGTVHSLRDSLQCDCSLCKEPSLGSESCVLQCGCYLCKDCSASALLKYQLSQQSLCPHCQTPLRPESFNFNKFLIA